jgi:hypothetical protein
MSMRNHLIISDAKAAFARVAVVAPRARVIAIKALFAVRAWPGREQRER